MTILIHPYGKISTKGNVINQVLFPVEIGKFKISASAEKFIQNDLNEHNVNQLFQFIPKDMRVFCNKKNLIPTKAGIFNTQPGEASQSRSSASQIPHVNEGNEVHFFFDGSYLIYFNINNEHFSLVVQAGDWIYIPANIEHWIKETEDNYLVIVSYHSESFETFHTKVKYTSTKSQAFL